jgi:FAD/FMN-containing dehydrogenase
VPSLPTPDLVAALAAIVGAEHAIVDPDIVGSYVTDWTGRFHGDALAVVRPHTVGEVAEVVRWCAAHGVAITTQGGNTSLVAGAVPQQSVVLLTRGLNDVGPLDPDAGQITVGAGVTLAAVHAAVAGSGWEFGVDLGARDTATIGGMVATNAGGIRVVRHGTMRANLIGSEAVLGTGDVISHLGGLAKDNTGYELGALLCGSEGTLGIVTAVRLRLVRSFAERVVALVGVANVAEAVALAGHLRRTVDSLDALEVMVAPAMAVVAEHLATSAPFADAGAVLLVEAAADHDPTETLAAALNGREAIVATDRAGRARLWRYRESQTEAIGRRGVPHKLDVSVPLAATAAFVDDVMALGREHSAEVFVFGHLGDGNLHVNLLGPAPDDERLDELVLRLVASRGGSISAEHGIGRAKRQWLHLNRSPAELDAFRRVKAALDPAGILNPGVLLPD